MYDSGLSYRSIAVHCDISPTSIHGIIRRYRTQQSGRSHQRSGRPPTLTDRDKNAIFRVIRLDPFITLANLRVEACVEASTRTILRWLKKEGIHHYEALQRPLLTEEVAAQRLQFALEHQNKPLSWWKRVIFSDEATIQRGQGRRQGWVFCKRQERLDKDKVEGKTLQMRHGRMFWAAIGARRRTSLVPLLGDPDSARGGVSGRVIQACLEENMPTIAGPGDSFFQDNARTHTAVVVQVWLQNWAQENGVFLPKWPPYSPDLNPIENLWKLLKERICKGFPELSSLPKNNEALARLERAAVEVWEDFEDDLLEKLIESMPRRMTACIAANGWYTKY
jgi:transposase